MTQITVSVDDIKFDYQRKTIFVINDGVSSMLMPPIYNPVTLALQIVKYKRGE